MSLDRSFFIEMEFVKAVCGVGGANHLKTWFVQCLPSRQREASLSEAMRQLDILFASELYRFAKVDTQELLSAARAWLQQMQHGERPTLPSIASPWLQEVYASLAHFLRFTVVVKEEKDGEGNIITKAGEKQLTGQEAAVAMWKKLEARKVDDLTLADVEPLMVHSHLLSKSVADAVAKRSKAILQATRKRKDGGGGSSKGSGSRVAATPKQAKTTAAVQEAAAATAALFA